MNADLPMQWPQLIAAFDRLWREPGRASEIALCDESQAYTYVQLHRAVGGCAGWLRAYGVRDGDRIAIAMERSARMAVMVLGAMAAGACPCPLEAMLGAEEGKRRTAVAALNNFPRHYPRFVLEQAAIAGALNPDILSDATKAAETARYIAQRLDTLSEEYERGWHGEPTSDGGL